MIYGVPIHLQLVEAPAVPSAVAESSGQAGSSVPPAVAESSVPSAVAESTVAESSGQTESLVPFTVAESVVPPPAAPPPLPPPYEPAPLAAVVESPGGPQAPAAPQGAALHRLNASVPADPLDVSDEDEAVTSAIASSAVDAQTKICATLLALARTIRRPRTYVGYSAFILMALLKRCRPSAWEGKELVDLLKVFAPWADDCTNECPVYAIPCALIAQPQGTAALAPISEEHPLDTCCHFVGGMKIPGTAVADKNFKFEVLYASIGIAILGTVLDGDCGLEVMTMMLAQPSSFNARQQLRTEISDYLMDRIREPWMHDLMVACQELPEKLVTLAKSARFAAPEVAAPKVLEAPPNVAPAVAEISEESETRLVLATPDDETYAAMRWASRLQDDGNVLGLIRSLPNEIIEEQLHAYRHREDKPALAKEARLLVVTKTVCQHGERMMIAKGFHQYCRQHGIDVDKRLPRGAVTSFMKDNIVWKTKAKTAGRQLILKWWNAWRKDASNVLVVDAASNGGPPKPQSREVRRSLLKSRAPVPEARRIRAFGTGRLHKGPLIRQELYE